MLKKILKITGMVVGLLLLIFVILVIYNKKRIDSGELVFWKGHWYTKSALEKIVPPQYSEVPAKNTPEEVYKNFREALLKNDLEGALGLIRKERKDQYRESFKNKVRLEKWIVMLPENISKERIDGNYAYYVIDMKTKNKNEVYFQKNSQGYWEIEGI